MPPQLQARSEEEVSVYISARCLYQPTILNSSDIQEITAAHKSRKYLQRMVSSTYPKPN